MASEWRPTRIWVSCLAMASSLAFSNRAGADPGEADKSRARALMTEGRAHRQCNEPQEALASFRGADAIMHVPTTGLAVAREEEALGMLLAALETLRAVLLIPTHAEDPIAFEKARTQATALADELRARIPTVRIVLQGDGSVKTLHLDGVALPLDALAAPRPLDPGHHVLVAEVGEAAERIEFDIAERETKTVDLELPAVPRVVPDLTHAPVLASTQPNGAAPDASTHGHRTIAFVLFGAAGVALGVGAVAGIESIVDTERVRSGCGSGSCPPAVQGDLTVAHTWATTANIGFGIAVAASTAGLLVLVLGAPAAKRTVARAPLLPWVGPNGAGVNGTF